MSKFKEFAKAIKTQFDKISTGEMFTLNVTGRQVWDLYLAAFPDGTNPIYRTKTQHDGNYDKSVIRRIGNLVNGNGESIWDIADKIEYPYNEVCKTVSELLKETGKITGRFRIKDPCLGYKTTTANDGTVYYHFHADIPAHLRAHDDGEFDTTVAVFERGLKEIKPSALDTILDMADSIYRGSEHVAKVNEFKRLQREYLLHVLEGTENRWLWDNASNYAARFRNDVIGTLAVDLSNDVDVEAAVNSFERKVAPQNYRRTSALITPGMVKEAMKTINSLGIEPSLARRHARLSDVSINNVLWVSNASQHKMKDGIASVLEDAAQSKPPTESSAAEISSDEFFSVIMPKARSMEVMFSHRHQKNLVSITAPQDLSSPPLFKWDSGFAWSYNGEVTDAIKERVKQAGGNVNADLRVSLAWSNYDDLDIHAYCPYGHVYFRDKMGILDVDMNAGSGTTRDPVENLAFNRPRNGEYRITVHQFHKRENTAPGFTIELECGGILRKYTYDKIVRSDMEVQVISFKMVNGKVTDLKVDHPHITEGGMKQEVWGVTTETFIPVSTVMLSPNYWDGREVGNKHTFMILDGCLNPNPVRGVYNEFLRGDLDKHRKVFEVIGEKTRCQPSNDQLSGLGFSSTVRESAMVRVIGQNLNKLYSVQF